MGPWQRPLVCGAIGGVSSLSLPLSVLLYLSLSLSVLLYLSLSLSVLLSLSLSLSLSVSLSLWFVPGLHLWLGGYDTPLM